MAPTMSSASCPSGARTPKEQVTVSSAPRSPMLKVRPAPLGRGSTVPTTRPDSSTHCGVGVSITVRGGPTGTATVTVRDVAPTAAERISVSVGSRSEKDWTSTALLSGDTRVGSVDWMIWLRGPMSEPSPAAMSRAMMSGGAASSAAMAAVTPSISFGAGGVGLPSVMNARMRVRSGRWACAEESTRAGRHASKASLKSVVPRGGEARSNSARKAWRRPALSSARGMGCSGSRDHSWRPKRSRAASPPKATTTRSTMVAKRS
mmetsp:Transcript_3299/g.10927  ORF Transcript_3299/g.10927 Transcript_3299/m.10927 type:complete len:262 (+) Transcript_3299:2046-2831(+)